MRGDTTLTPGCAIAVRDASTQSRISLTNDVFQSLKLPNDDRSRCPRFKKDVDQEFTQIPKEPTYDSRRIHKDGTDLAKSMVNTHARRVRDKVSDLYLA